MRLNVQFQQCALSESNREPTHLVPVPSKALTGESDAGTPGNTAAEPNIAGFSRNESATKAQSVAQRRFWAKVERSDGCWLWTGGLRRGYGVVVIAQRRLAAHRVAYEWCVGPVPSGLFVLHSCDTPSCVRPDHLRVGTHEENTLDAMERKRFPSKVQERARAALIAERSLRP